MRVRGGQHVLEELARCSLGVGKSERMTAAQLFDALVAVGAEQVRIDYRIHNAANTTA
jgi:hypothetical protein